MTKSLDRLEHMMQIGIALSSEKNPKKLLETILSSAKALTNADGGTIYSVTEDNQLQFDFISTDSLNIKLGGDTGQEITFKPLSLVDERGQAKKDMVVACVVNENKTINISDAYNAEGYDFSGTRKFDQKTGYRTKSILTVPMTSHEDEIIGVLQLINSQDTETGDIVAFSETDQRLAEAMASQAAVALTNQRLIADLQHLFESFIQLIAVAIDEKSPYTGSHCHRIPAITMMLAEACHQINRGPLVDFSMSDDDRYELETAAWLHDCGKITSPEYVMDKSTKLETIFDRIQLLDTRFEVLIRDAEIDFLKQTMQKSTEEIESLKQAYEAKVQQLRDDRDFLRKANIGGEFMREIDQQRVLQIAAYQWSDPDGEKHNFLTEEEVYNLNIQKGTLTAEERTIINNHMVATIKMLESLPFPKSLQRVPEYAGGHHERMDGNGYPKGLTRDEMSVPARVMAIGDVFEALTARDRPYKKGKTLTECLTIMGKMTQNHHLDPDIFNVFVSEKVYMQYAEKFMHKDQIDQVDEQAIPGYVEVAA